MVMDHNTMPSSGCCFHATLGLIKFHWARLLLSLCFCPVEFQLVVHAVLSILFLLFCTMMFVGQFCFFWGCWVYLQLGFSIAPALESFVEVRVLFHDAVPLRV